MKKYYLEQLSQNERGALCVRAASVTDTLSVVQPILEDVRKDGDAALFRYTERFDGVRLNWLHISPEEITVSGSQLSLSVRQALSAAAKNIERFHAAQKSAPIQVETTPGVTCTRESRAIEKVGLYIPGGSAPLPSAVLMLGIPARLAGCTDIVLCTPPQKDGTVPASILYAASMCGITQVFAVGGAQAIAGMAYGTETIPKVYKIFGPGNQYVTAAKMLVSIDPDGAAIDMPAGPTEILVVADELARADFVAADLLSQAEHSPDATAVLVCTSEEKTGEILVEVGAQLTSLPRRQIAERALQQSFVLVVPTVAEAIQFVNDYAPEHALLNVRNAERYAKDIQNAGSVFIGAYACESAGDYASGPNHTLPTYGYARMYSGVSVESFQKYITFQTVTPLGARTIGPTVMALAELEGLIGHKRAMEIRMQTL